MNLISAREAFDRGLTRYFTGKICVHGHVAERMISNGCCVECLNEKRKRSREDIYEATKVWRLKNPNARNEEAKKYRKKYPEKVARTAKAYRQRNIEEIRKKEREYARRMRATNPEKEKERLARFYEKKNLEKVKIAGRNKSHFCEICNDDKNRIVFDHCHETGKFRGWICDRCNRVLGSLYDDVGLITKMLIYLENNNGRKMDTKG
jgi:hypothetical protein